MLIEEFDLTIVDALGDLLPDLMRAATLDHVQARPAILRLRARRGTHEEVVLELSLQSILFDVISQCNGDFPIRIWSQWRFDWAGWLGGNTYLG